MTDNSKKRNDIAGGRVDASFTGLGRSSVRTWRLYVVLDSQSGTPRLIKAISKAQALRYAALGQFYARAASSIQVAELIQMGVRIEDATLSREERLELAYRPPGE